EGHAARRIQPGIGGRLAVAVEALQAVAGEGRDHASRIYFPQSVIAGVADEEVPGGVDREAAYDAELGAGRRASITAEAHRRDAGDDRFLAIRHVDGTDVRKSGIADQP